MAKASLEKRLIAAMRDYLNRDMNPKMSNPPPAATKALDSALREYQTGKRTWAENDLAEFEEFMQG